MLKPFSYALMCLIVFLGSFVPVAWSQDISAPENIATSPTAEEVAKKEEITHEAREYFEKKRMVTEGNTAGNIVQKRLLKKQYEDSRKQFEDFKKTKAKEQEAGKKKAPTGEIEAK